MVSTASAQTKSDPSSWILWRADSQKIAELISGAEIVKPEEIGLSFSEPSKRLHLGARKKSDGILFSMVINEDLTQSVGANLAIHSQAKYRVTAILTAKDRGLLDNERQLAIQVQPGGATVLRFQLAP